MAFYDTLDNMETPVKNLWKKISRMFPADADQKKKGLQLFQEYDKHGFLSLPTPEILGLEIPIVADFFYRLSLMHSLESPILRRRDTRWMSEFDYTLINIRAAGTVEKTGNFISAAMFLSTLRTRGIIIAPVTQGRTADLSILESHVKLRNELTDPILNNVGIGKELQFVSFCEAAHLMGLVIGYDFDYHVDPYATVVLKRPELFLWTHEGRFQPDEAVQDDLRARVREIITSQNKDGEPFEREEMRSALESAALSPRLSKDGSGRTALSLRKVMKEGLGDHRDEALAYWGKVFDLWRDRYGFDFLVLRGTRLLGNNSDEIPDLSLIRKAADAARKAGVRRNIGVVAEGKAEDVENFGVQGIDLLIENNADSKADLTWFQKLITLEEHLHRINLGRKLRFSVAFEIDPGNVESRSRRERALIKRFVARFLRQGPSRRPLLETMGSREGAWGYNAALKEDLTLGWIPDKSNAARGRFIENIAMEYRNVIDNGEYMDRHVDERKAWWVIKSKQALIIAVVSVENEDLLPPESVQFDYSLYTQSSDIKTILEYDFSENRGKIELSNNTIIECASIPYRGFRLYAVV